MHKLSIIVPVYNAEKTLYQCIESIIQQEYVDFELILIDDGSSDNSLAICNKYSAIDGRISVIHQNNSGLVKTRKKGVEVASGEYVGFIDSDDYIDSDMYSRLMKEGINHNPDIIIGGISIDYKTHNVISHNLISPGLYNSQAIKEQIIPQMLMKTGFFRYGIIPGVVVKIFKRDLIREALNNVYDNITIGEDIAITSYSIMYAKSISIISSAAYHYIQTEASMIRGYNPKRFDSIFLMYDCVNKITNQPYQMQLGTSFACILYSALVDFIKYSGLPSNIIKSKIKELLNHKITTDALRKADISSLPLRDKLKIYMLKSNYATLFYTIFKPR